MSKRIQKLRHTFKKHQLRLGRVLAGFGVPEYTILTIFSIFLGIVAGFAGVGLHELIAIFSSFFFGDQTSEHALGLLIIFLPVAGMLIQSLMTTLAPKEASQRGVIEIIKAVGLRNGRIPFRTTLFHFLAPAICIGTGGSVGPEAPAAQSGAGAVAAVGKLMGLTESRQRVFTAAAAGAAIAAIFNTPLAGVFFSIEVVLFHDFRASALSAFLLASVSASAVSRIILGNEPAFMFNTLQIGSYRLFIFYLLLGITAGMVSIAFIRTNEWFKQSCQKMYRHLPKVVGMATVGLLMGLAGYWYPEIFGIGYETMNRVLADGLSWQTVSILLLLKFILVALILGAGGFGGVFAPSLFMGACLGYIFAIGLNHTLGIHLDPTAYTLVGMGAVLAGINSVPLTAIMILFEMTNDYHFILPLMVGIVGSTLVVQMTLKGSIYARELQRQGFHYSLGRDTRILESISVSQVMRKEIMTVPESVSLAELIHNCLDHPHDTIYTTDRSGKLNGVILSSNLHQLITEYQHLKTMVIAKDLADSNITTLKDNDNLDYAMRVFAKYRTEEIPVVSSKSRTEVLGCIHYQDILNAYNQAKVKFNLTDELAGDLLTINPNEVKDVLPGFSIMEIIIPNKFSNKTIKELRLRNRFEVDVLMIEKDGGPFAAAEHEVQRIFPYVNYRFSQGDKIIIFGKKEKVATFKEYTKKT
ncbi:MAG: chloride channel protein [bacterium]